LSKPAKGLIVPLHVMGIFKSDIFKEPFYSEAVSKLAVLEQPLVLYFY
jgi:hypothetical protein